jgi:hypothetical protein
VDRRPTCDNTAVRDHSLRLADGRTLSYTDLDPSNRPTIMYFHGTPSSRLDLASSVSKRPSTSSMCG